MHRNGKKSAKQHAQDCTHRYFEIIQSNTTLNKLENGSIAGAAFLDDDAYSPKSFSRLLAAGGFYDGGVVIVTFRTHTNTFTQLNRHKHIDRLVICDDDAKKRQNS